MTNCADSHAFTAVTSVLQSYFYLKIIHLQQFIPLLRFSLIKNSALHKKAVINKVIFSCFSPHFLIGGRRNSTFSRAIVFLIVMGTLSRCCWLEEKHRRMAPGNQVRQNLTSACSRTRGVGQCDQKLTHVSLPRSI